MEFHEFNDDYTVTRKRLRTGELSDVSAEQERLLGLVEQLADEHHRQVARNLIARLPDSSAAAGPQSPELVEALQIQDAAFFAGGTKEQKLAALAEARKRIWQLADRAGADSAQIRGLTRMLEHRENNLTDDLPWTEPPPDEQAGS